MINIAADIQIPEIEARLDDLLDAEYSLKFFDSSTVSAFDLKNIDALLVRSTLSVNQELCEGTGISFIASATAGVNHLDRDFLESEHIAWSYAPGCNAYSVIHYVLAAIGELIQDKLFQEKKSIGILGYGNIGKRLYKILKALNFDVYACDPFVSKPELVDLDSLLECDLVTIHVPLTFHGSYPTINLVNESHIKKLTNKVIINTSRGEVVSEALVMQAKDLIYICDVWINEPSPSRELIQKSYISTPHIAGYSIEGKLNGAKSIAESCAKQFQCLKAKTNETEKLPDWPYDINKIIKDVRDTSFPMALFNSELDLKSISASLKALSTREIETGFRSLRENHPPRHDFNSFSFKNITHLDKKLDTEFFYELGRAGYF